MRLGMCSGLCGRGGMCGLCGRNRLFEYWSDGRCRLRRPGRRFRLGCRRRGGFDQRNLLRRGRGRLGLFRWGRRRRGGLFDLGRRNYNGCGTRHALRRDHPRDMCRLFRCGRGSRSGRFFGGGCRRLCGYGLCGSGGLRRFRRRLCSRTRRRLRMNRVLFLLRDGLQHIARLGDLRKIEFRLRLFDDPGGLGRRAALSREVLLYALCFVCFDRAGMRLLLGDADLRQHVENLFTFDFQLPGQIVNSNLHPPSSSVIRCPSTRLSLHINLTVGIVEPSVLLDCYFSSAVFSSSSVRSCAVTSDSSAGAASSTPSTASASKSCPVSSSSFTLSGASSGALDSPVLSAL